jgi:glyceraldehyde 3-phosphate dehydrogenase
MSIKVGINGFGRIGRQALKAMVTNYSDSIEVVGINDLFPPDAFGLQLRYDSVYGKFDGSVEVTSDGLIINGREVKFFAKRDPGEIPWGEVGADVVVESSGVFPRPIWPACTSRVAPRRSSSARRPRVRLSPS